MGLGGSYRYSSGINQYTERKMRNRIFKMCRPKYYIHGHIHLNYGGGHTRRQQYGETEIINGYQFHKFEYETGKEIKMF